MALRGTEHRLFERRLGSVQAVVHNQDNREHDLLDSDDYYQFEGGLTAAVRHLSGDQPAVWHNDHSRPETPRIRRLEDEIARVVRARVVNPKWIAGVMRHGYKGAFEMAATVDYLFAFAATAKCVKDHHFDLVFDAYFGDEDVRAFLEQNNPDALCEMADRLLEAQDRGWRPRSNTAYQHLTELSGAAMAKKPTTDEELDRANEKSKKRKEARDKMLADKTVEKGLLIVHTGKGKGKSTAAFGLAARAVGNGMKVGVVQFVKGKWETGERAVLEHFPDQVTIRTMGEGFTWETQDKARDITAAEKAWEASKEMIAEPSYDLVILDELNIVLRYDYLDLQDVLDIFANKRDMLHVVVTGRNAKPELIDAADLVTEMTQIKHPFREQNVRAQKGIEF